jgi:hypothetical protein
VQRTQREVVNRGGVAYTVVTWDDELGDAEILVFDDADALIRRGVRTFWPAHEQHGSAIGEEVWFGPAGNELERRPLRAFPSSDSTSR